MRGRSVDSSSRPEPSVPMDGGMTDEELLAALRRRAADPDRRLECETSAFFDQVTTMDLGQLFGALGQVTADLQRHLADPLDTPPDVLGRALQLGDVLQQPAGKPLPPPATVAEVEAAEAVLGHPLPALLRRILLEVANGGFGPGYGLLGVGAGGWTDDRRQDLVALAGGFEDGMLPVAHLGDVVYACVDTRRRARRCRSTTRATSSGTTTANRSTRARRTSR